MRAVWYDRFGPAAEVLRYDGEGRDVPTPEIGRGHVLVRLATSGVNPSDVKLRAGARPGAEMEFHRIVPHSDGAGVIEAVGEGVNPARVGQRVWVWNAQWQRAEGTAAELVALPEMQAVGLPEGTSFEEGACLGIPAMTAWMTLFADGGIADQTVLITGGAGTVGRYAIQMACLGGARRVITTVSGADKAAHAVVEGLAPDDVITYTDEDVVDRVMAISRGRGVDRIVEVEFGGNLAASTQMIKEGGTVAAYASSAVREPVLPFYPLMFKNVRLHMALCYLMDPTLRARGASELTEWLRDGRLSHAVGATYPLAKTANAHEAVESGAVMGTVVVTI